MKIAVKKTITTTQVVEKEVTLPYYSRQNKDSFAWHYLVSAEDRMVVTCYNQEHSFASTGLRTDTSDAFGPDTIEITREEFEAAMKQAMKITMDAIPYDDEQN